MRASPNRRASTILVTSANRITLEKFVAIFAIAIYLIVADLGSPSSTSQRTDKLGLILTLGIRVPVSRGLGLKA